MSSSVTPLRYPGGKTSLYNFLSQVIKLNRIGDCTYIEPYAGGAGAAVKLLLNEYVSEIVINDADIAIASFWKCILYRTEEFVKRIYDIQVTIGEWRRQHDILFRRCSHEVFDELDIGFATFFLNRCNWSGVLGANPIGGIEQKGKWKINARFNKNTLISKIEKIACYNQRIKVFNMDAVQFLDSMFNWIETDVGHCLVYLDPPYYEKGSSLYRRYYKHEDHSRLAGYIKNVSQYKWLLSYDDVRPIKAMYKELSHNVFNLNYFAHTVKVGRELIMASHDCSLPESFVLHSKKETFRKKSATQMYKSKSVMTASLQKPNVL